METKFIMKSTLLSFAAGCVALMAVAAPDDNDLPVASHNMTRTDYHFPTKVTPDSIIVSGPAVFNVTGNTVGALPFTPIFTTPRALVSAAAYPAGGSFFAIYENKGKNAALTYSSYDVDVQLQKYNNKKLGNPLAATYTPDGLQLLVATPDHVNFLDVNKLQPVAEPMPISFDKTDRLKVSDNMYYLVVAEPTQVAVYNLETRKKRAGWDFETIVNDFTFNPDCSRFYVITDDGILTAYDTRTFLPVQTLEDLGEGLAVSINQDGKYAAVLESPEKISIINLLSPSDRHEVTVEGGEGREALFVPDNIGDYILVYNSQNALRGRRLLYLKPNYGKLVNDEVNNRMNDWMKMMPGETMEEYNARVNDESRLHMRRVFEEEASTRFAPDLTGMAAVTLGNYDRANGVLAVDFDNMPSIFLPVPEADIAGFSNASTLEFRNSKYGVMADDNFELVYAEVFNSANGKTYVYDNIDRTPLNFMSDADNVVSIEFIQQQQMEEIRLQELRDEIMKQAKTENLLTDNTQITVDSRIEPDYDANGERILNYHVTVTYDVAPEFSASEDFGPGKYHVNESNAANAMLDLVKQAFEGDFAQYIKDGKKLRVNISGTADATPIVSRLTYDGSFGEIEALPYYNNGQMTTVTMNKGQRIEQNEQLAFLRAFGVKDYLEKNVPALEKMARTYRYDIAVSEEKGSANRRISADFVFIDAF